jgi:hypothetical protein
MNRDPQTGGAQKALLEFLEATKTQQLILLYITVILTIVFKDIVPVGIYNQLDSVLGRLLIVALVAGITIRYNWIIGLLSALAFALFLGLPSKVSEGFGSGGETSLQIVPTQKRWFVERLFHENPIAIEEEKVMTQPVQNDSPSGVGGGVQNTSIQ